MTCGECPIGMAISVGNDQMIYCPVSGKKIYPQTGCDIDRQVELKEKLIKGIIK
jgi:hypothetical protein